MTTSSLHRTEEFKLAEEHARSVPVSPAQVLLDDLLASTIVLTEDFEKLSAQTQDEIRQCAETQKLLPLLVRYGL